MSKTLYSSFLHNYFDATKLFSDLPKFLNNSAKLLFSRTQFCTSRFDVLLHNIVTILQFRCRDSIAQRIKDSRTKVGAVEVDGDLSHPVEWKEL